MSDARPSRESLHARARAFVEAFERGAPMPEPFDTLACDLARHQAAHVPAYGRLCRVRGVDPATLGRAADAPAVPTDAFKLARIAAFPPAEAAVTFRTSGTTAGSRGTHEMRDASTYDAAAHAFGKWALTDGFTLPVPVLVLGPPPEEASDSSLTHMIDLFVRRFGTPASSAETYFLRDGVFELPALDERVSRLLVDNVEEALVLTTSFALVHFLEALGASPFPLPRKTRLMQTGGYKGKSREVSPAVLRRDVARVFGIDERAIVSEYGMTELSSQFYEALARDPEAARGVYVEPPWARVVPVDPETLAPVPDGEVGIARIEDLMNVESAFAVLAADRVRRTAGGFELLGRAPGAPPRGCSLAIDELFGRGADA
jgi:hypothetical protein